VCVCACVCVCICESGNFSIHPKIRREISQFGPNFSHMT